MCISSIPESVAAADRNDLKPSVGRVMQVHCSMVLLDDIIEIFDAPISRSASRSSL
jgi:hypothetical protein